MRHTLLLQSCRNIVMQNMIMTSDFKTAKRQMSCLDRQQTSTGEMFNFLSETYIYCCLYLFFRAPLYSFLSVLSINKKAQTAYWYITEFLNMYRTKCYIARNICTCWKACYFVIFCLIFFSAFLTIVKIISRESCKFFIMLTLIVNILNINWVYIHYDFIFIFVTKMYFDEHLPIYNFST